MADVSYAGRVREVDPMLGADLHDARHVRAGWICKLGGAAGEKGLESRGRGGDQHAQRDLADVLECMHRVLRHESRGPRSGFMPDAVGEKTRAAFEHKEPFILVGVPMWRRAGTRWRGFDPLRERSAGLLTGEMEDDFLAECVDRRVLA
jgi:hypothetical protein